MALVGQGLLAVLLLGTLLSFTIAGVGWWNRHKPGAFWFAVNAAVVGLWIAADLVSLIATSEATTVTASVAGNIPSNVGTFTTLLFIASYLGYDRLSRRTEITVTLVYTVAAILLVGGTYWQGVYFASYDVARQAGYAVLVAESGLGHLVNALSGIVWIFLALALLLRAGVAGDRVWRSNVVILVIALLLPTVGSIVILSVGFPDGLPISSALVALTVLLYAYTLRREGLFELSPASERIGVREAFDDLGAGVLVVSTDRTVLRANTTACDILDASQSKLVGADLELIFDELGIATLDALPTDIEHDHRFYQVTASPVGGGIGSTILLQDVTERRQREQRLSVLNRVLRHNLRNELNVVTARIDYVADEMGDDSLREKLVVAAETATDLVRLSEKAREIEGVLDATDEASEQCVPADIVEDIVATFESSHPAVSFSMTTDEPSAIRSFPKLIDAVVENIIENAVVHNDAASPSVEVSVQDEQNGVRVLVTDNGPGIPNDEVRVLDSVNETALEHGSGLGLWLVNWAMTRLQGDVSFERTATGTRVELQIPDLDRPTNSVATHSPETGTIN